MPSKIFKVNGHYIGIDKNDGSGYIIEFKKIQIKTLPEEEIEAINKAMINGKGVDFDGEINFDSK
jgi:hypothetical protein